MDLTMCLALATHLRWTIWIICLKNFPRLHFLRQICDFWSSTVPTLPCQRALKEYIIYLNLARFASNDCFLINKLGFDLHFCFLYIKTVNLTICPEPQINLRKKACKFSVQLRPFLTSATRRHCSLLYEGTEIWWRVLHTAIAPVSFPI